MGLDMVSFATWMNLLPKLIALGLKVPQEDAPINDIIQPQLGLLAVVDLFRKFLKRASRYSHIQRLSFTLSKYLREIIRY